MRVLPPVLLLAAVCGCGGEPEATPTLGPDAHPAALAAGPVSASMRAAISEVAK